MNEDKQEPVCNVQQNIESFNASVDHVNSEEESEGKASSLPSQSSKNEDHQKPDSKKQKIDDSNESDYDIFDFETNQHVKPSSLCSSSSIKKSKL